MTRLIVLALVSALSGCAATNADHSARQPAQGDSPVRLGNFSVSLAVKDLAASRAFYEKLGFRALPIAPSDRMAIMQNDTSTIGLFQGVLERNTLTFNPGWDRTCGTLPDYDDVRDLQRTIKARGIVPTHAADEATSGPGFMILTDPDGNPIFIDQHVPSPGQ